MENGPAFVDFYAILQVHPECDSKALEASYRHLAKIYHPDHPQTADLDKFGEVLEAYRFLRNSQNRAGYDVEYALHTGFVFTYAEEQGKESEFAMSDAEAHSKILIYLYKRRRESAREPGHGHFMVQQMLNCSDENFDFYIWYLKEKGFIQITEQGTLAITVTGVDHVITLSRSAAQEQLRISQLNEPAEDPEE
jgi:curved DNA-binding protein